MSLDNFGASVRYYGTGTNDNDVVFETNDVSSFSAFMIMSTAGAVDVYGSLDGENFSTAPLALQDFGAVTNDPVLVTAAGRMYGCGGKFRKLKVMQNGATAAAASMLCWAYGTT